MPNQALEQPRDGVLRYGEVVGCELLNFFVRPHKRSSMTPESAKTTSHQFLRDHDIPINDHLPLLEGPTELKPQNAEAVARRCVVLSYVIGIAYGADVPKLNQYLKDIGLLSYASSKERQLLGREKHSEQEQINAGWIAECVQSLAWCMGLVELNPFCGCDENLASHIPRPFVDPSEFIAGAELRPFEEMYQQADLHYRLHWAARNASLTGTPCAVSEELIMERRKPLDWVIGVEEDWDKVPGDT
jgi:hypothetical protein